MGEFRKFVQELTWNDSLDTCIRSNSTYGVICRNCSLMTEQLISILLMSPFPLNTLAFTCSFRKPMINLFFVDEYYERVICWYVTEGRSRKFLYSCKFAFYDEAWRRQHIVVSGVAHTLERCSWNRFNKNWSILSYIMLIGYLFFKLKQRCCHLSMSTFVGTLFYSLSQPWDVRKRNKNSYGTKSSRVMCWRGAREKRYFSYILLRLVVAKKRA